MDESLTDEERAELKEKAVKALRTMEADLDRSEEIHHYTERGQAQMIPPARYEWFNEALRDLQRAGEAIPDWRIRPVHTIKWRPVKRAPLEDWADGSSLRTQVKQVLATVDPQ
jgi:hypothetical protein